VDVDKGLTIRSENGAASTTVTALYSNDHVFEVTADYVSISGFTVKGALEDLQAGIYLYGAHHCIISDNTASSNDIGIGLYDSGNNELKNNSASNNNCCGIWVGSSGGNTITNNTVSGNYYVGICLLHGSWYNNIHSNIVSNNGYGGDYAGIYLQSLSSNNIYNNYFNNSNNVYDDGNNTWNTTKTLGTNIIGGQYLGGNYWSDYSGKDLDGDGLGDTLLPYNSSGSITTGGDWHPLTTVGYAPPEIISFAPPSPVNDTVCNWRTFNVTVNQTVNVSWYLNNTLRHTNVSTKEAKYTLHAEVVGEHNVSAIASNANGTDMQTWVWNVTAAPVPVLEINKTDNPDPVSPGGTLNYSIRVNNTGNATATNVGVMETYDENVTFVAAVPTPSSGNDTWQFATLNASETRWINISVSVNPTTPIGTVLHNIVNVSCDQGVTDTDTEATTVFYGEQNCTCGDICVIPTGWWRNGSAFHPTDTPIQAAIDNAISGETICVMDGTYTENVDVDTQLTIRSENGAASTTVTALYSNDPVFEVTADYVSISGFSVKGATGGGNGITLTHGVSYCDLSNNNCSGSRCGITLCSFCSHNTLTNNIANSNDIYGIHLFSSNSNNLTNNIANSNKHNGIHLYSSNNNAITNNIANSNNNSFGYGISLFRESSNNTLEDNTANSNNNGINLDSSSNYNTLANNTADSNNDYGIYLSYSSNNMLESNTASNNDGSGIYLYYSSDNTIYNNYFNNTNNALDDGNNIWNITKTAGPNIIGGSWLGGNYWSDYAGTDTDGDGLGDTLLPYNASGEIITGGDWHPLVQEPSPCFIATAAYGTPLHEDINVLRKFRDEYLMPNPVGQAMVKLYYTTSPPVADLIRANEGLRTAVRDGLVKPLVEVTRLLVE